jgi:hypothetical protein
MFRYEEVQAVWLLKYNKNRKKGNKHEENFKGLILSENFLALK